MKIALLALALLLAAWGATAPLDGVSIPHIAAIAVGIVLASKIITSKKEESK